MEGQDRQWTASEENHRPLAGLKGHEYIIPHGSIHTRRWGHRSWAEGRGHISAVPSPPGGRNGSSTSPFFSASCLPHLRVLTTSMSVTAEITYVGKP